MIAKLTGRIDTLGETFVILDVGGVGYFVSCSSRTLRHMGSKGEQTSLLIETVMRAETLQLYGFGTSDEQDCCRLLITVQGVGMRMALALLGALAPSEIYQAIASQDKSRLTQAEGVGPKLASRILSELKDKIPLECSFAPSLQSPALGLIVEDAISALVNLGYRRFEAIAVIQTSHQQLGEKAETNDLIRQGLRLLARNSP